MMKYILLTVICTIVISDLGLADEVGSPSRQESIGVGTGAVLGGSVGGPVGSILGAALGSWLGDRFYKEQTAKLEFEQRWEALKDEFVALFMEAFSESELMEMAAFYETPTGQKAIEKTPQLVQRGAQIGARRVKQNKAELERLILAGAK